MKQIILPLHPFSRAILTAEHGPEPLIIRQHDVLFAQLSLRRVRPRGSMLQIRQTLTTGAALLLDDDLAAHVIPHAYHVGVCLFRLHKETMCRYVHACNLNGVPALQAIRQFYALHQVTEDDYQEESAWKAWQRWAKTRKKKPHFSTQKTGKASVIMSEKRRLRAKSCTPIQPLTLSMSDISAELAASRFLAAYTNLFRRQPKHIAHHARIYFYMVCEGMSSRDVARKLGVKQWAAAYARRAMEARARHNKTIERLLHENLALPRHA